MSKHRFHMSAAKLDDGRLVLDLPTVSGILRGLAEVIENGESPDPPAALRAIADEIDAAGLLGSSTTRRS